MSSATWLLVTLTLTGAIVIGAMAWRWLRRRPPSAEQATFFHLERRVPAHGNAPVLRDGSRFVAINESDIDLPAGTRVTVTRVDGPKLYVKRSRVEHPSPSL